MLRPIYLTAMGCFVGSMTGAACGHFVFWLAAGAALGLAWHRAAGRCITDEPVGLMFSRRRARCSEIRPVIFLGERQTGRHQDWARREAAAFRWRQAA